MSASLEKNILFNAPVRYKVTQSGMDAYSSDAIARLFDGSMEPNYTYNKPVTSSNPLVITIEGLPGAHTQEGAWVGFSTRYWPVAKFKIEGYDEYGGANSWKVFADVSGNTETQFAVFVSNIGGAFTKLRFTFYEGCSSSSSPAGQMGLSELFFIHTEAAQAYDGLLVSYDKNMAVKIGDVAVPSGYKLGVDGKVLAEEITVKASEQWPDYVFEQGYDLAPLSEVDAYLKANGHLPGIPSAEAIMQDGVNVSSMVLTLTKKVEELTLYLIELKKQNELLQQQIKDKKTEREEK